MFAWQLMCLRNGFILMFMLGFNRCNLWTWSGLPLPEPDDARISQFAERNTNAEGEIETTHHVAKVAAVKL